MKEDTIIKGIGCAWVVGAVTSLAITGVIVWAIVRLVMKYG